MELLNRTCSKYPTRKYTIMSRMIETKKNNLNCILKTNYSAMRRSVLFYRYSSLTQTIPHHILLRN